MLLWRSVCQKSFALHMHPARAYPQGVPIYVGESVAFVKHQHCTLLDCAGACTRTCASR